MDNDTHLQLPRQKEEDDGRLLAQNRNVYRVADIPRGVKVFIKLVLVEVVAYKIEKG